MLGLVAVLSGALVVYLARTIVPRADDPIPPDVPPAHCVLALGLLWLPWIALLAAKVGGGGVAARYTIGATLGLALSGSYVAYWLGRRASAVILMCLLLAFASKEAVFWGAETTDATSGASTSTGSSACSRRASVAAGRRDQRPRVRARWPTTRPGTSRAGWSPSSTPRPRASARAPIRSSSTSRCSSAICPIVVQTLRGVRSRARRFLLYATPGHGEWWQSRLLRDGFTLRTLAADGSRVLYEVSRRPEARAVLGLRSPVC